MLLWELSVLIWEFFGRFYGKKSAFTGFGAIFSYFTGSRAFRIILEFRAAEEGLETFSEEDRKFGNIFKRIESGEKHQVGENVVYTCISRIIVHRCPIHRYT